jgi:hypothetical protein
VAVTVRVYGLRELNAKLSEYDALLRTQLGDDLKEAAQPVAEDTKDKVSRYQGVSLSTIRTRRRGLRIWVEQGARKVTGLRGDFGALQMRKGLIPALEENRDDILIATERALGEFAKESGF